MEYWLTNLANAATILTGLAVLSAVFPYFQGRRQRRQDADKFYVERYWQIHDRKTPKRRSDGSVYIEIPFDVLFAELMLCEDELEARAAGHVTQISWNRWSQTIRAVLQDPEAAALLDALPASAFDRLRAFRADGADPIRIGRFRQFWRGLL